MFRKRERVRYRLRQWLIVVDDNDRKRCIVDWGDVGVVRLRHKSTFKLRFRVIEYGATLTLIRLGCKFIKLN